MQSVQTYLKDVCRKAIKEAFPSLDSLEPILTVSSPKFGGDYQLNSAMSIYKQHAISMGLISPKAVAEHLVKHLDDDAFEKPTVAPAGFIMLKLKSAWVQKQLKSIWKPSPNQKNKNVPSHLVGVDLQDIKHKNVVIDFSSPNIAKEMHVGHLRSTIIGDSLARILEYCGLNVERVNHVGDWGTQFGMLVEFLIDNKGKTDSSINDLQDFYKKSKERFDIDPEFKKRSQLRVVKLQSGDEESLAAWRSICEISRTSFQEIYDRLNVSLVEKGESYYNKMIPEVAAQLKQKNMVKNVEGAQCVFVKNNNVPLMLVKSDGGFGYDTTDIAAIHHRLVDCKATWVIYVTDIGQSDHFQKLFFCAEDAGWHNPPTTRLDHIGFGLVQGDAGKKFKTRSGETVRLVDLLDEAAARARTSIEERQKSGESDLDEAALQETGQAIGYSSVKYFDLKQNRVTNYKFSFDKMLESKGNTGVYMLYAYARICAVFRKCGVSHDSVLPERLVLAAEEEQNLGVLLLRFPEIIETLLADLHVHRLAEFMYDVADKFTSFYQNCKVAGVAEQDSRLVLCEMTRRVLEVCFHLMGITALDRI